MEIVRRLKNVFLRGWTRRFLRGEATVICLNVRDCMDFGFGLLLQVIGGSYRLA